MSKVSEPPITSAPNRAISNRAHAVAIISTAPADYSCWKGADGLLRLIAASLLLPSYRRGRDQDRAGRSSLGRASLTTSGRPPNSLPSKPFMAARPSASLFIVTNAKPRGWPVSRSVMTLISVTLPNCSKICWRSVSVMVNEIFPT